MSENNDEEPPQDSVTRVRIAAGLAHGCAIRKNGSVVCWGSSSYGQLGDELLGCIRSGPDSDHLNFWAGIYSISCPDPSPQTSGNFGSNTAKKDVALGGRALALAAGASFTCAILSDQRVKCWGKNSVGNLGNGSGGSYGDRSAPAFVVTNGGSGGAPLTRVVAIAAGRDHACAIRGEDKTLWCWGANDQGQLGLGPGVVDNPLRALQVVGAEGEGFLTGVVSAAAGDSTTCAVVESGKVYCWGANFVGEMGSALPNSQVPVEVSGLSNARVVTGSGYSAYSDAALDPFFCALLADTTVKCWGGNDRGQLGDGTTTPHNVPLPVLTTEAIPLAGVRSIHAGGEGFACALMSGGELWCWGRNDEGQLGDGLAAGSLEPVPAALVNDGVSGDPIESVSLGTYHGCAMLTSGAVRCWGMNAWYQLGENSDSLAPVTVAGISTATDVSVAENGSCAVLGSGDVQCWGNNGFGQLGDGSADPREAPVSVTGISTAGEVALSARHACALLQDGTVKCWGANDQGQLGGSELGGVSAISSDGDESCARMTDETVRCWGRSVADPGDLGLAGVASVDPGDSRCVLKADGSVECTPTADRAAFSELMASAVATLYLGKSQPWDGAVENPDEETPRYHHARHYCAKLEGGELVCWGDNDHGELGNGVFTDAEAAPVTVSGVADPLAVGVGGRNTCAIVAGEEGADNSVLCWGWMFGLAAASPTPVTLDGFEASPVKIAVSDDHACAVLSNGKVQCWGQNRFGQLGSGQPASYRYRFSAFTP